MSSTTASNKRASIEFSFRPSCLLSPKSIECEVGDRFGDVVLTYVQRAGLRELIDGPVMMFDYPVASVLRYHLDVEATQPVDLETKIEAGQHIVFVSHPMISHTLEDPYPRIRTGIVMKNLVPVRKALHNLVSDVLTLALQGKRQKRLPDFGHLTLAFPCIPRTHHLDVYKRCAELVLERIMAGRAASTLDASKWEPGTTESDIVFLVKLAAKRGSWSSECSICLDMLGTNGQPCPCLAHNRTIMFRPCGHAFCQECIFQAMVAAQEHFVCPLCKAHPIQLFRIEEVEADDTITHFQGINLDRESLVSDLFSFLYPSCIQS